MTALSVTTDKGFNLDSVSIARVKGLLTITKEFLLHTTQGRQKMLKIRSIIRNTHWRAPPITDAIFATSTPLTQIVAGLLI